MKIAQEGRVSAFADSMAVGGESEGTRLCGLIPVKQGKYRGILPNLTVLAEPELRVSSISEAISMDSLRSRTGNSRKFEAGSGPTHLSVFI